MAPATTRISNPILPPPIHSNERQQHAAAMNHQNRDPATSTPTPESRMNPPPPPRPLVTPSRDVREDSTLSNSGGSARKPRQNLDEHDHILMIKHCHEQRAHYKEGTKAQFWTGVSQAFQAETGKVLAQMSATVGRLVETRRRQISDWENGVIPQKPSGELYDRLDQWMEFLRVEDADAELERMRQVDARRKVEEARKEARRQAIAAEQLANGQTPTPRVISRPPPPANMGQQQTHQHQQPLPPLPPPPQPSTEGTQQQPEVHTEVNGYRSNKRRRINERTLTQDLQVQIHQDQWPAQQVQPAQDTSQYSLAHALEPPKRVVVEGAMTKDDWRDIMGNDARLRTLESKVDKIEMLVTQNNKLLLQLVQQHANKERDRDRDRNVEEERVPVHLDAEFERDYLSGPYAKTPRPVP